MLNNNIKMTKYIIIIELLLLYIFFENDESSYSHRAVVIGSGRAAGSGRLCSPAGVQEFGGMDVNVRRQRFIHEWAEAHSEVTGVFLHQMRQSQTRRLQPVQIILHGGRDVH